MKVKCIKDYKDYYGAVTKGKIYDVTVVTDCSYGVKNDINDSCLFDKNIFEVVEECSCANIKNNYRGMNCSKCGREF